MAFSLRRRSTKNGRGRSKNSHPHAMRFEETTAAEETREERSRRRLEVQGLIGENLAKLAEYARPGSRGWAGAGGGSATKLSPVDEFRGTSVQVCGLYPFIIGATSPMVGVPIGRNIWTGATVCCDPISWFQRAGLVRNPSVFILGLPALGKSSLARKIVTGSSGYGTIPIVMGDLRPDFVKLIRALDGQVISLGPGRGYLNVLDPGEAREVAERLRKHGHHKQADEVITDYVARRQAMLSALITIQRRSEPAETEELVLDAALRYLDKHFPGVPVLQDLMDVIREGPTEIRDNTETSGNDAKYHALIDPLVVTLHGLISGTRLGGVFAQHTSEKMRRDRAVVFDVSAIEESNTDLQAAVLMACWAQGFGSINVAHALADAGLEPRRHYLAVLDELWKALRAGRGMVDRMDALTRMNRREGTGVIFVTHSMKDLNSLPTEEDRMKARGFIERTGYVMLGGLPPSEMPDLTTVIPLTQSEQKLLEEWQVPENWDPKKKERAAPPGRGKFLIKVGGSHGIPVEVKLTHAELVHSDTDDRWHEISRVGGREDSAA